MHNINIPVHFKWNFEIRPGRFAVYLYAGPVLSVGLAAQSMINASSWYREPHYIECRYDYYSGNAECNYGWTDYLEHQYDQLLDKEIQAQLDAANIRHRCFDMLVDFGVGFRFRDRFELVLGADNSFINRYRHGAASAVSMTMAQPYIGFRYRFFHR
ncbi:MAG: hypothetical protein NC308_10825 [Clostridium sp.]|nr:hypothetical protein [Bacteroides sp.]MCM1199368.1 hypothetical protein [Clostridium sp.]